MKIINIILLVIVNINLYSQQYLFTEKNIPHKNDLGKFMWYNDTLPNGIYHIRYSKDTSIIITDFYVYNKYFYSMLDTLYIKKSPFKIYYANGSKRYEFYIDSLGKVDGPFKAYSESGNIIAKGRFHKDSLWTFMFDSYGVNDSIWANNQFRSGGWIFYRGVMIDAVYNSFYESGNFMLKQDRDNYYWYFPNGKIKRALTKSKNGPYSISFFDSSGNLIRHDELESITSFWFLYI